MEYSARNIEYQQNSFDLRGTQKFVWLISSDTSSFKLERMQETTAAPEVAFGKLN